MNREAFKQRMQNLKSYREQNPGKGYWDFKSYEDGGEVPPTNKPTIIEPIPYKGKLYSDRYGRKYTEEQVQDYYNNGTDEIDRFTGGPLVRGLKPLLDLEDAANFTPVGDAVAAYDVYDAVSNRDWSGAGLAALGLVPFMPMTVKQFRSKYKGITPKTKSKGGYGHNFNTSVNKNITNNSYMIKSIVSTPLVSKMCEEKGIKCYEVLTGCKNIANKRNELIDKDYLFGFEESLGYMFNINVNDKNGFSSMLSFLEILCYCKSKNITLNDYIENIFKKYGYYKEETLSFVYSGLDGKDIINNYMDSFRNDTIKFDKKHTKKDYLNEENELHTNALKYVFEDNSWIMLRPSGTEPKIKIYLGVKCDSEVSSINELNKLKSQINEIFKVES